MRVDVRYPRSPERLVLRTEDDWATDVQPIDVQPNGATFELDPAGPFLALKVGLRTNDGLAWSRGPNYVLNRFESEPELYPYFFAEPRGTVSDVMYVAAGSAVHALRVYCPPGYDENTERRYPVVYMHDGQNLFFPEEAFRSQEWQIDETMDRLDQMNAIRKAIVVGVVPRDRMHEYTDLGYEAYGQFLAGRLKPLVDAHYRTLPGPANTIVMGSSLGGVVSLYLAHAHSDTFGRAACMSSTFGDLDDLFLRIASAPKAPIAVYLDSGWPLDNYDKTNTMRDLLIAKGWKLGVDLLHFAFPDGSHNEHDWAMRVHLPFQFCFGKAWRQSRGDD